MDQAVKMLAFITERNHMGARIINPTIKLIYHRIHVKSVYIYFYIFVLRLQIHERTWKLPTRCVVMEYRTIFITVTHMGVTNYQCLAALFNSLHRLRKKITL